MREHIRAAAALSAIAAMEAGAELTGVRELVFPEIGALTVGLLVVDKKVWHTGKLQVLLLLIVEAAAGVAIYRLLGSQFPTAGALAAFATGAAVLAATGTGMLPAIAACLMPNILGIGDPMYVGCVAILGLMLIGVQALLEMSGMRTYTTPIWIERQNVGMAHVARWCVLLVSIAPMAVAAALTGMHFLIAPPLVITLVEFCSSHSGFRQRPWQILGLLTAAAALGSGLVLGCNASGVSPAIGGIAAALGVLGLFRLSGKYFAPAMAVAILALHVPHASLPLYPMQIAAGAVYCMIVSEFIGKRINKKSYCI